MNPKRRINRSLYLRTLARMTPSERLMKAFELSHLAKSEMKQGLRVRFPDKDNAQIHALFLDRLRKCHNRNY